MTRANGPKMPPAVLGQMLIGMAVLDGGIGIVLLLPFLPADQPWLPWVGGAMLVGAVTMAVVGTRLQRRAKRARAG